MFKIYTNEELAQATAEVIVSVQGAAKQSHDLLGSAVAYAYNNDWDLSQVRIVVGSFRRGIGRVYQVARMVDYLSTYCGIKVTFSDDELKTVKKDRKWAAANDTNAALAVLEALPWYEHGEAEKPVKKPVPSISSFTNSMAVLLAIGDTTLNQIKDEWGQKIADLVRDALDNEKVQDKAVALLEDGK